MVSNFYKKYLFRRTISIMMSSLEIQVAEQDEGIHSDIDYDFFETDQKLERTAESRVRGTCDAGNEKCCVVDKTEDASVNEVRVYSVAEKENRICAENRSLRDASVDCDGHDKQTFVVEAVIEGNPPSTKGGNVQSESEKAGDVNRAKLDINLHELLGTGSSGATVISDSKCSRSEGQRLEDKDAKCCSPPRTFRNDGKYRELMNCIAFQTLVEEPTENVPSQSPGSGSSDTTSDLTDVTPRSLSSCASVLKYMDSMETMRGLESGNGRQPASMKLLVDAINHLHRPGSSMMSGSSSGSARSTTGRLNMTFTNEEVKKIERENGLLLKKIQSKSKPLHKPGTAVANQPRLSSSAINRRRMQQRIEHDNLILMKKIQNVKVAINTGITPKLKRR